jgi:ABC-type proline/glycine betaine transport system ATPase subunit
MDPGKYLDRYPFQLSGGQQQRVGVARAFACDPDIILMDEPFSALDPINRASLQEELVSLEARMKKTIVFVTHDMDEAIKLANRICIIYKHRIVQYDTPEEIIRNPANEYVAQFIDAERRRAALPEPEPPEPEGPADFDIPPQRDKKHGMRHIMDLFGRAAKAMVPSRPIKKNIAVQKRRRGRK